MEPNLAFKNEDPGAVQHGNFINYYQFNCVDERLKMLPEDSNIWLASKEDDSPGTMEDYLILDIGCNAGDLTQRLYQFLSDIVRPKQVYILGIDLDEALISRSRETNQFPENVQYNKADIMNRREFDEIIESFLSKYRRKNFDAICCFSITMWIHLNHDDVGLQNFLRTVAAVGKLIVIEPQPWKCYQTAERRLKKSGEIFPLFLKLKWRSNVEHEIQSFLENDLKRLKIYESIPTKWKRRICFYR